MLVSFIIPTLNSETTIEYCIKSIIEQKCRKEIIVIDGQSTDNTKEIIKKFDVHLFFEKKLGQAAARNKGLRNAKGDYIAFIDSDVILPKKWIEKSLKKLNKDSSLAGVGGPGISIEKNIISLCLDNLLYGKSIDSEERYVNSLATMNILFRKSHIKDIFFNENLLIAEDPEFNFRIRKKGYKLLFSKKLFVYHNHPTKIRTLIKKWYRYGRYYMFPYLKHKDFIGVGFLFRTFFFPLLIIFVVLSLIEFAFLYIAIMQFFALFIVYLFIGFKNCRKCKSKMLIIFPIIHTIKQLSQMFGIFVSIIRGI